MAQTPPNNQPTNPPAPAPLDPKAADSQLPVEIRNEVTPTNLPPKKKAEHKTGVEEAAKKPKTISTQDTLLISEIRDGMVVMRDGSLRAVVMCQSINFDLMSSEERESVEYAYQGFLNSLGFEIQIFIRSQRIDLANYIEKLQEIHSNQDNILLGLLMEDYIAYVEYMIESSNIMNKQFYVIVPYHPPLMVKSSLGSSMRRMGGLFSSKRETTVINEKDYDAYKNEMTQRVQVILDGMNDMNVQAIPLNTQELIELYYGVYNPQTAPNEPLTDVNTLEAPIVGKGEGDAPQILRGES